MNLRDSKESLILSALELPIYLYNDMTLRLWCYSNNLRLKQMDHQTSRQIVIHLDLFSSISLLISQLFLTRSTPPLQ